MSKDIKDQFPKKLLVEKHTKFFLKQLEELPRPYSGQATNRVTLLFFILSGLDVLKKIDKVKDKKRIIDWIYARQITPEKEDFSTTKKENFSNFGFIGGSFFGSTQGKEHDFKCAHLTMTYAALACLKILGDDLSRVNKKAIINGVKHLQQPSGTFKASKFSESDVRFVFCACAISTILNDWSGIDQDNLAKYLLKCRRYDQCFGNNIDGESHSGSAFCIISALFMMGKMDLIEEKDDLILWFLKRQIKGFQGRPNKLMDTCYTYWISSSLKHLGAIEFVDKEKIFEWVLKQQNSFTGGTGKTQDAYPDLLHSYMTLSGLSILGYPGLNPVYPALNMTYRATKGINLKKLQ